MASESEPRKDVAEVAKEKEAGGDQAALARASQEKPESMRQAEAAHAERRVVGETPSSADLPPLDFFTGLDEPMEYLSGDAGAGKMGKPNVADGGSHYKTIDGQQTRQDDEPVFGIATHAELEKDAAALREATYGQSGTDEKAVFKLLEGKTPVEVAELKKIYERKYKISLEDELRSDMSGDELAAALALLNPEAKPVRRDTGDKPSDEAEARLRDIQEDPQVKAERARLTGLAEAHMTNPYERMQFLEDMDALERRAAERGLTPKEIAETYKNVARLIENPTEKPLDQEARVKIAEQVMTQAATPTTVDQGRHNTCNVSTVESRLYTRNPAAVAGMVADMATTGTYRMSNGTVVELPEDCLKPDREASHNPPADGDRSHASQIFQVTAVNMYYAEPSDATETKGLLKHILPSGSHRVYRQENAEQQEQEAERDRQYKELPWYKQMFVPAGRTEDDTGERLVLVEGDTETVIDDCPDLDDDAIVWINNAITGEKGEDVFIEHESAVAGKGKLVTPVASEEYFNEKLAELKAKGKLPIILGIDTNNEPFFVDGEGNSAGGAGSGHVVTITDYHPGPPPKVEIDNQWGSGDDYFGDKAISVHDIFLASMAPGNRQRVALLQSEVDQNRNEGKIDGAKEVELVRAQFFKSRDADPNPIYDASLAGSMAVAMSHWDELRDNGTLGDDGHRKEHERGLQYMKYALDELPRERQEFILETLRKQYPDSEDVEWLDKQLS